MGQESCRDSRRAAFPSWCWRMPRRPAVVHRGAGGCRPGGTRDRGERPKAEGGRSNHPAGQSLGRDIALSEPVDRLGYGGGVPDTIVEESTLRGDDNTRT